MDTEAKDHRLRRYGKDSDWVYDKCPVVDRGQFEFTGIVRDDGSIDWRVLDLSAGDGDPDGEWLNHIRFCPFCGVELEARNGKI